MRLTVLRWIVLPAAALLLAGCGEGRAPSPDRSADRGPSAGQTERWTFDQDRVGGLPGDAKVFSGSWAVRAEADAPTEPNALCQTGRATYPALSLSKTTYSDVVVSARFKPVSGRVDQAAGIIFRIRDKNNYYIVRANALEGNVNVYKYTDGKRANLKEGKGKVTSGAWQELRVEAAGNRIRGFLEGKLVVEARDDSFQSGGIGLWTKADSVTCFDSVRAAAK